jgi:hypothetical protein
LFSQRKQKDLGDFINNWPEKKQNLAKFFRISEKKAELAGRWGQMK